MVYPGHPSTGCLQCIKRKVKCDEGKPACRRCRTRGEQCPGYQRPRYKFVTSDPKGNAHARRKRVPSKDTSSTSSSSPSDHEIVFIASCSCPDRIILSRDRSSEALSWYLASYTIPKVEGEAEYMDFLPTIYQEAPEGSYLRMAIDAASLAAYANYFKKDDLTAEARRTYGAALVGLNQALRDESQAKLDQTLTAVLNMVLFETITAGDSPYDYHMNGLLSMLQLRGEKQFHTARGRMLFRVVQLLLQTRPLVQNTHHDISSAEYDITAQAVQMLPALSSTYSRVTTRAILTLRINHLCVQGDTLIRQMNNCPQRKLQLVSLIQEAATLDAEMQQWVASFPLELYPKEVRSLKDGSRRLTYIHHMIPIAWNMYCCGRMMLHEMAIRCRLCLVQDYDICCNGYNPQKTIDVVRSLADDICDSIPFCLYDIGNNGEAVHEGWIRGKHAAAYLLLWPLMVVKLGTYTTHPQKLTATETLDRIGKELGIKQACRLLHSRNDLFET